VCATHTSQKKRAGWAVPHAAGAVERLARDRVRLWNDGWWEQTDVWRRRIGYTPQARCVCDGARPTTSEPPRRSNPNKQTRYEVRGSFDGGSFTAVLNTHFSKALTARIAARVCLRASSSCETWRKSVCAAVESTDKVLAETRCSAHSQQGHSLLCSHTLTQRSFVSLTAYAQESTWSGLQVVSIELTFHGCLLCDDDVVGGGLGCAWKWRR
jgi:hypothetical protein